MDKIDVILYILIGLLTLNVISLVSRVFLNRYLKIERVYDLIQCQMGKGDLEGALYTCERNLRKRPEDNHLLWSKGKILFKLGKYSEAENEFKRFVANEPEWQEEAQKYINSIAAKI